MSWEDENPYVKDMKLRIIDLEYQRAVEMMRPCNINPVCISKCGEGWVCFFGSAVFPIEAVSGYGKTPEEACLNFDKAWRGEPHE